MKMSHHLLRLSLLVLLIAPRATADDYPRDDGVDILHYAFQVTLSDANDEILGVATVRLRVDGQQVRTLNLDLVGAGDDPGTGMTVRHVRRGEQAVAFTHEGDRLAIRLNDPAAASEEREYTIEYSGTPADGLIISKNRHGDRTFFGDNFPNRARHWLPTLDHPHDKATCEFTIIAPDHYRVIATGTRLEERELEGDLRRTHTRQDTPLSTYLMVIGVARFAVQELEPHHTIPISTWVYPQDEQDGFHDFALAAEPMEFFTEYIGPYPWSKLANVQSTTRYGGMENAGNIFYGERAVTGRQSLEGLIAHEIAHQWFGDSVTVEDWHHVWLSEGFATYFTHLFIEHARGREIMVRGLQRDRDRVIGYAQRNPDQPIIDPRIPVENILSPNVYQKAGWVLHMLRKRIGDERFRRATSEFHRRFRHDNAVTDDFLAIVEEVAGVEFDDFFRQWFYTPGVPEFKGSWAYDEQRKLVTININQNRADGTIYDVPLEVGIVLEKGQPPMIKPNRVKAKFYTVAWRVPHEPVNVVLDPNTWLLMKAEFGKRE